jgi:hypothetical protein
MNILNVNAAIQTSVMFIALVKRTFTKSILNMNPIHALPFIGFFSVYLLARYIAMQAAKESFARVKCLHQNRYLKIVEVVATCETTVEVCEDCGKEIPFTKKTEC